MNKQLEQANKYAELCDVAYVAWKKRQNFTKTEIEFGDDCKVLEGRKYYEVIRGRKGACCHMGYVCKQTGKLYKEQRQKAKWDLLDTNDTELLFANLCPFGGHLYNTYITKVRGAK